MAILAESIYPRGTCAGGRQDQPEDYPDAAIPFNPRDFKRQTTAGSILPSVYCPPMTALVTLARLVKEA